MEEQSRSLNYMFLLYNCFGAHFNIYRLNLTGIHFVVYTLNNNHLKIFKIILKIEQINLKKGGDSLQKLTCMMFYIIKKF